MLGAAAGDGLGAGGELGGDDAACDAALAWLYERDRDRAERDVRSRAGGDGASQLTVPEWLDEVHRLFPRETIERLERDAVERYQIHEIVTNAEVLQRVEPSTTLLKAVLRTKHLMNAELLGLARDLAAKVIARLMEKLARKVRSAFTGARARRPSRVKLARAFDAKRTIKSNLRRWDRARRRLGIDAPLFHSHTRRSCERWQVILLVDESGSMLGSVIHAAVTAACLWGLPGVKTHLCIFDTKVVDLTESVTDPVEVLMRVQLGGGTDIGKAVAYAASLVESPRRAIVAVVSDFYEGGDAEVLVARVRALAEQGVTVLGLAALDEEARPAYDKDLAQRLVNAGAHVGAMTPGELVDFVARAIQP
ncbi:MAG: VWA domain-containing protein [Labilithrix sp.]|nr:VWA domain-containing protein [Labilithrix sp.]MCW5813288.1 VWA domain-containing protein [Labilithrix sp.]